MSDNKKEKIFLGKDDIIYVDVNELLTEEDVRVFIGELKKVMKLKLGKAKILVDMDTYPIDAMRSSRARKMVADEVMTAVKDPGFQKTALFGGNLVIRTIASFIVSLSKLDSFRIFENKKEALKWLNEP